MTFNPINNSLVRVAAPQVVIYGLTWMGSNIIMISPLHAMLFSSATYLCNMIAFEALTKTLGNNCLNTLKGRSLLFISVYAVPLGVISSRLYSPLAVVVMLGLFSISSAITGLMGFKRQPQLTQAVTQYDKYIEPLVSPSVCFGISWVGKSIFLVNPWHCFLFAVSQKICILAGNSLAHKLSITSNSHPTFYTRFMYGFAYIPPAMVFFGKLSTPLMLITMIGLNSIGNSVSTLLKLP